MKCSLIGAAILLAAPALAGPDVLPVKGINRGVYDLATGGLSPEDPAERMGESIWGCMDTTPWYFGSYGYGWAVLDWGDLADDGIGGPGTDIGGFAFAYATDLMMPVLIDAIIVFYGDENGHNSDGRFFIAGYWIANLPTGTAQGDGWVITLDLEAQALEFTIDANDLDGDGLMDFGYVYWFINLPPSATGPMICECDPNVAPGVEDGFDAFSDPNLGPGSYVGSYWFGGDPFLQLCMELFAVANIPPPGCPNPGDANKYCEADIVPNDGDGAWDYDLDGDCRIQLNDLAQLLGHYGMTSGATREDGDVHPTDAGDGDVDLADLAELLSQYGDDCTGPRS